MLTYNALVVGWYDVFVSKLCSLQFQPCVHYPKWSGKENVHYT